MPKPITIAITDDQELIRKGLSEIITASSPHKVVLTAEHGEDLLEKLSKLDSVPDVCLLDISMPVMNGYDTMIEVNKRYPQMRCLTVTIIETEFSVINMIRNGARGYLAKNSSPKELIKAIETIHTSGYYYSNLASEDVFGTIEQAKLPNDLTEKDYQFLILCCSELNLHRIADQMCISYRTALDHQNRLCGKLHVKNRMGLVMFVFSSGLLPPRQLH